MIRLSAIVALLAGSISASAQDVLYKTDKSELKVRVIEAGESLISYKLWEHQDGPLYKVSRNRVHRIVYENGVEEIITVPRTPYQYTKPGKKVDDWYDSYRRDSVARYGFQHNVSMNFLAFFNNEFGFLYRREFFRKHFNVVVPVAFGVQVPKITNRFYFRSTEGATFVCKRKRYEAGIGINYYPSLGGAINYYVGPVFRYIKYEGVQTGQMPYGPPGYYIPRSKDVTLSRYTVSITNGLIFRTKSRLTANCFMSLGYKIDVIDNPIEDARGYQLQPFENPAGLIFWAGLNLGFNL